MPGTGTFEILALAPDQIAQNTTDNDKPIITKGNLTESNSSILTITGGSNSIIGLGTTIEVAQATTSTNGYLSSTDWNTFNNKQDAITTGTTAQYLRGDLSLSNFNSDVRSADLTGFTSTAGSVSTADKSPVGSPV